MHRSTEETERLAAAVVEYALDRIRMEPPPLDGPRSSADLAAAAGATITQDGLGWERALELFADVLAPASISSDHPSFFAFVPGAPTPAASLFDLIVSASSINGAGWMDGAGAIWAEDQALAWLASEAGLPAETAGGAFVSGGSAGNLSGLVAARQTAMAAHAGRRPDRWRLIASHGAHSSVTITARVMDAEVIWVPMDERGRLTGDALAHVLADEDPEGLFAVVATSGTTNLGIVDDLAGVADVCDARGLWLHVDGAYGGAGVLAPSVKHLFQGLERADSFIVDPHKWLFAPFDCCALLYADRALAEAAFTQEAEYLEVSNAYEEGESSPSHYAYHLSRRARGLPFWFSVASHGTDAYRDAVETVLSLTREVAEDIRVRQNLELILEPELSVVVFRRLGWGQAEYTQWCDRLLEEQIAFALPTLWNGEWLMRLCFVNPTTTIAEVQAVLDTMGSPT